APRPTGASKPGPARSSRTRRTVLHDIRDILLALAKDSGALHGRGGTTGAGRSAKGSGTREDGGGNGSAPEEVASDHRTGPHRIVWSDDLGKVLKNANVKVVVLSSCSTAQRNGGSFSWDGVAGALMKAGVPVVFGMQYPLSIGAANKFTNAFYDALGVGLSLDEAVTHGRQAIMTLYKLEGASQEDIEEAERIGTREQDFGVPVVYSTAVSGPLFPELKAARAERLRELHEDATKPEKTRSLDPEALEEFRRQRERYQEKRRAEAALARREALLEKIQYGTG
ncbi:MAG: CHAT domain-containing protein, partial [Gemmatimonadota bacterium]|nr:CHAT domain-containing protein [Gemmatimonadota bacterium]